MAGTATTTFESTSRYVTTAGGWRLHYHEAGAGATPLILLHGGGAGSMAWTQFCKNIPPLGEHFHVIAFDLPQYGRSDKPLFEDEPAYDGCTRILAEAIEALGLPRGHVVGVSQGGGVACLLAHALPDAFDKLVLVSPGGLFDSILAPVPMDTLRDTFEYYNPGPQTRERLVGILRRMVYDERVLTDDIVEMRWRASIDPESVAAMRNFGVAGLGDVGAVLGELPNRALIVWGIEDRVLPLDVPLRYLKAMRDADCVLLSRVGHWIPFERAETFNRIVVEFLRDD